MCSIERSRARYGPVGPGTAIVALLLACTGGCATNTAPVGWLSPAEDARYEARGGWAELLVADPPLASFLSRVEGELIAAATDTVFVLTDDGLKAVPTRTVRHMKVTPWRVDQQTFGIWASVGVLSTLSHGVFLLLTAPVWLAVGGVASHLGTRVGQVETNRPGPEILRHLARFPQGLLPGIDRAQIERGGLERPPR